MGAVKLIHQWPKRLIESGELGAGHDPGLSVRKAGDYKRTRQHG
jgi:hypothetical protein